MKKMKYIVGLVVIVAFAVILIHTKNQPTKLVSKTDLDRPLVVGIIAWPGYAGGVVANRGLVENAESIFYKKYGQPVRFVLVEDIDARGKAFAKGGPDGIDVMWSTVDFWANELPGFKNGGVDAAAFMQVDWSQGGDALVVSSNIRSIADLKNKKIALVQYTPSHWLLESVLRDSQLTAHEQEQIRKNLVFTQDGSAARAAFMSGHVEAAVLWEPEVQQALAQSGAKVLVSSKDMPNTIGDVMVVKKEFLEAHPQALQVFARGWFDGVREIEKNEKASAQILVDAIPTFAALGVDATEKSLSWVHLTDEADNQEFFGLSGKDSVFDKLFQSSSEAWKSLGVIDASIDAPSARDTRIIKNLK